MWSENIKFTTKNAIDSNILSNTNQKNDFLKKIYEWSGAKSLELLYRGSRDGMYSKNFHEKYMNGVELKVWNYYIQEVEMVCIVKIFMKNVMIKVQLLLCSGMIKEIYLEDIYLCLGKIMEDI